MRHLVTLCLLAAMLVATVSAVPPERSRIPKHIDPAQIGPEASELDLSEFDMARQNTLRRLYNKKKEAMVERLIEKYPKLPPPEEVYAETRKRLRQHMLREESQLRRLQNAKLERIVQGTESDETLRLRLKNRQRDLQEAAEKESKYRQRSDKWDQRAAELARRSQTETKAYRSARASERKFHELALHWKTLHEQISQQIRWLENQLQQIETRKTLREAEEIRRAEAIKRWTEAEKGAEGHRDKVTEDNETFDSQGSDSGRNEFSVVDALSQQAGRLLGDRFGPLIRKTGDIILKQWTGPLPASGDVPGGLPGRIGVPAAGRVLAY